MSNDSQVANLLGMARTAEIGGNETEALEYYNRVLEIDPTVADAWFGKGKAAAWQSTLANFRVNEAVIAFNHSLANDAADNLENRKQAAVDEINKIVSALYSLARKSLEEYPELDSTWPTYLVQVSQMTEALETARSWKPHDRVNLENIVHLCKDNIEGFSFRDKYNNNMPVAYSLSPEYEVILRDQMERAVEGLKTLDSSYQAPQIEKKVADACFVVTATMGDFDHPHVGSLRAFRDSQLLTRTWGKQAVRAYYHYGPYLARIIDRDPTLKFFSLWLIVKPAAAIARRFK